jgi:hypothetical protein
MHQSKFFNVFFILLFQSNATWNCVNRKKQNFIQVLFQFCWQGEPIFLRGDIFYDAHILKISWHEALFPTILCWELSHFKNVVYLQNHLNLSSSHRFIFKLKIDFSILFYFFANSRHFFLWRFSSISEYDYIIFN